MNIYIENFVTFNGVGFHRPKDGCGTNVSSPTKRPFPNIFLELTLQLGSYPRVDIPYRYRFTGCDRNTLFLFSLYTDVEYMFLSFFNTVSQVFNLHLDLEGKIIFYYWIISSFSLRSARCSYIMVEVYKVSF